MSKKTSLINQLVGAERKSGGSFLTHEAREHSLRTFTKTIFKLGYTHIDRPEKITEKHILEFCEDRMNSGVGKRTIQNNMSAVRTALRHVGKENFANSERISNRTLGIAGASRHGTKEAIPEEIYQAARSRIKDDGVNAVLELARCLGLRDEEGIRSVKSLKTWEKDLRDGKADLKIVFGTKTGRQRETHVVDIDRTLRAVREALRLCEKNGGRIIDRPTLAQAKQTLSSKAATAGLKGIHSPHSLRYRYAQELEKKFLGYGFTWAEASALTSMSLGHGDGRGRYVHRVYSQKNDSV